MTQQEALSNRCTDVARLSRAALDWINDPKNAKTVEGRAAHLPKMLRKNARRAERLGRAARTKMSVSVFGPSQAGKSFLVSVLARPNEGRLVADFNGPGGKLDYISQVNPAGDGESTGLVTRFTMTKAPTPDGFPIQLNLLSEADIARTLINSFYEDGDLSEMPPTPDHLSAHFAAFAGKAQATPTGGLDYEEIHEIADYVQKWVSRSSYAFNLAGFWDEAAELAPRLSPADRGQFLSILWGEYAPLTDLYVKLSTALATIGHAEVVYAPLAALQPRETSIIDVNTLQGLFGPEGEDMLPVQTAAGQNGQLNRAVMTALAAELVFPMEQQPSPLFAETDLLDFPGARNRFEAPLSVTLRDPETAVTNMLLRGKVAYLFDRYVSNQEITSMLLCVPDSNMETLSLPGLVEQWIELTHGATPEERAQNDCILFFVMTKFDKHLIDSASGAEDFERFERRMDASLLKGFGKVPTSWVHRWAGAEPFKNCYWLRNPYYPIEALIRYQDNREVEILPEKVQRVAELKAGCLQATAVQQHFKDPERAWEAALGLNDGGVSYLIEELAKVCKPESKLRQISTQIEAVAGKLAQELSQFYVSDDVEKRIEEKRLAAARIIDGLEFTLSNHRFGSFLHALTVDQDAVQDRISRVPSSIRITNAVSSEVTKPKAPVASPATATRPTRPGAPLRPGAPVRPAAPAAAAEVATQKEVSDPRNSIRTMTPESFQADTAIAVWVEKLNRFREDEDRLAIFHLNPDSAADLVNEMVHGFSRVHVRDRIMETLRGISYGLTVDKQAPSAAIVCSERINDFVTMLGARDREDGQRLMIDLGDGHAREAFAPRRGADSADTLPQDPRPSSAEAWTDWVFALDALFVDNAKDGEGGTVNIEQNLRLGSVLGELSPGTEL